LIQRGPASVGRIKAQQRQLQKQAQMTKKKEIDDLAEAIATDLLTVFDGESGIECDRMACMLSKNGQCGLNEKDMGGRNKGSMIKVITTHLRKVLDSWE
jgi:hypothetical protein